MIFARVRINVHLLSQRAGRENVDQPIVLSRDFHFHSVVLLTHKCARAFPFADSHFGLAAPPPPLKGISSLLRIFWQIWDFFSFCFCICFSVFWRRPRASSTLGSLDTDKSSVLHLCAGVVMFC